MSQPSIEEALKQAGAPDYMVLIITKIVSAEDAIREMQAALSKRAVELRQQEQEVTSREQMFAEQQQAFVKAAKDMTEFADRLFGSDSELSKINSAAKARDEKLEKLLQDITERVTVLEKARKSA